ncbi:4-hydroxy-3-methylbut-2-enyl diphosphate reductase [Serratia symbiotica]|nr:4-hydroxy-3-methylbut-2-enyl diphosphate reductase [Serratia symbiotica]
MKIWLANPRGFCAGVDRAINIVEYALKIYGPPIYVRHEIVHNRYIVNSLRIRGVIFVEDISEVSENSILIFSAHGVSKDIRIQAYKKNLTMLFDATCPLVTKVHMEVSRASRNGIEVIFIGHSGHPEVDGTMGQYNNPDGAIYLVESKEDILKLKVKNEKKLCFMTQTTLSIDDTLDMINLLYQRFPKIIGPHKNDICYATINRQLAVRNLIKNVEIVLIIGSKNSSNSNRLVELVKYSGKPAYLIDSSCDIQEKWFHKIYNIGITAGASAPDILVEEVISYLKLLGEVEINEMEGYKENIIFSIPKELYINIKEFY